MPGLLASSQHVNLSIGMPLGLVAGRPASPLRRLRAPDTVAVGPHRASRKPGARALGTAHSRAVTARASPYGPPWAAEAEHALLEAGAVCSQVLLPGQRG